MRARGSVKRGVVGVACACASLVVISLAAGAETLPRLPEGAPVYASVRPLALLGALKRLGVDQVREVAELKKQLGVDPLDPKLLEPSGLDIAAPINGSFFEMAPGGLQHHRVVATLRDPLMFTTFLGAIAMTGQAPITMVDSAAALGKLGIRATSRLPDGTVLIARIDGELLIVDGLGSFSAHAKDALPAEIARRYPLKVAKAFRASGGARSRFTPQAALILYADGRKLGPLLAVADNPNKNSVPCLKQWAQAQTTFDDVALVLSVTPDDIDAEIAWGAARPLPLKFRPVDDGALDVQTLSAKAPLTVALYAASTTPFVALKRSGPQASFSSVARSIDRCGGQAWAHVLVRSWPQVLGAVFSEAKDVKNAGGGLMLGSAIGAMGQLRNVAVAVRDNSDTRGPRGALTATFDPQARPLFDIFLASAPGGAKAMTFGKRAPSVYHLPEEFASVVAAVETLAAGQTALTLTDSDDSLQWALKVPPSPTAPGALPLLRAHLDPAAVKRMPAMERASPDFVRAIDALLQLRRLEGSIVLDGSLFRLVVRAAAR